MLHFPFIGRTEKWAVLEFARLFTSCSKNRLFFLSQNFSGHPKLLVKWSYHSFTPVIKNGAILFAKYCKGLTLFFFRDLKIKKKSQDFFKILFYFWHTSVHEFWLFSTLFWLLVEKFKMSREKSSSGHTFKSAIDASNLKLRREAQAPCPFCLLLNWEGSGLNQLA